MDKPKDARRSSKKALDELGADSAPLLRPSRGDLSGGQKQDRGSGSPRAAAVG